MKLTNPKKWLRYLEDYKKYLKGEETKYIWYHSNCNFCGLASNDCRKCIWVNKLENGCSCQIWSYRTFKDAGMIGLRIQRGSRFVKRRLVELESQIRRAKKALEE